MDNFATVIFSRECWRNAITMLADGAFECGAAIRAKFGVKA